MSRITKIDLINMAFEHLRISGITTQAVPEEIQFALSLLERMAAELQERNIVLGYNFEDVPDVNSDAGIGLWAANGIETNLAARMAASFGKTISNELALMARQSMSNLSSRTANVRVTPYPHRQPRGNGNTLRYNRWARYYRPQQLAPNSPSTIRMVSGEINDYTENYQAYLRDQEDISVYTITTTSGLSIVSSSNSDINISYRVEALSIGVNEPVFQSLKIVMTTSNGRVVERQVNFNVANESNS